MDIGKYWRTCPHCKKRKNVKRIPEMDGYGDIYKHWTYHDECLEEVLCYPEKYGHIIVDYMLGVVERIASNKREKAKEESDAEKYRQHQIVRAKSICVDELMEDTEG